MGNRVVKFRGKRIDNGEWVYGAYMAHDCGGHTIFNQNLRDGTLQGFEVVPETVGQYIGLKDKNGVEICEGDIITTDLERPYLIVEYINGAFMLNCNDGLEDYYDMFFSTSEEPKETYKYGEVIGNITDNPELMEEQ